MSQQFIDMRKHPRVFFSASEPVSGQAAVAGELQPSFPVTFLSLSEGGISMLCRAEALQGLAVGAILLLQGDPQGPLRFLQGQGGEVRYMLRSEGMPQATLGCRFSGLDAHTLRQIQQVVRERQERERQKNS